MNISMYIEADATDEMLLFVRQLGIRHVFTSIRKDDLKSDFLYGLKESTQRNGLELIRVMSGFLGKNHEIHLGLPKRDQRIDEFIGFLEISQMFFRIKNCIIFNNLHSQIWEL